MNKKILILVLVLVLMLCVGKYAGEHLETPAEKDTVPVANIVSDDKGQDSQNVTAATENGSLAETESTETTKPLETIAEVTEPDGTEPKPTDPEESEPKATEPEATKPKQTEPDPTEWEEPIENGREEREYFGGWTGDELVAPEENSAGIL